MSRRIPNRKKFRQTEWCRCLFRKAGEFVSDSILTIDTSSCCKKLIIFMRHFFEQSPVFFIEKICLIIPLWTNSLHLFIPWSFLKPPRPSAASFTNSRWLLPTTTAGSNRSRGQRVLVKRDSLIRAHRQRRREGCVGGVNQRGERETGAEGRARGATGGMKRCSTNASGGY